MKDDVNTEELKEAASEAYRQQQHELDRKIDEAEELKTQMRVVFLTLAEISAKISMWGNLKKNPAPRCLGAIMTKLGFIKERKGHDCRRGYWVREHLQSEIDKMRSPDLF